MEPVTKSSGFTRRVTRADVEKRGERRQMKGMIMAITFGSLGVVSIAMNVVLESPTALRALAAIRQSETAEVLAGIVPDFTPVKGQGRRLETSETCHELHPGFCGDPNVAPDLSICFAVEELEGTCCLPSQVDGVFSDVPENSVGCVVKDNATCDFSDVCVSEIIPGAGIGAQCLKPGEASAGGAIGYFLLMMYLFIALAIIVDDYFAEALNLLGDYYGMSDDIKGATFAAMGSSAPEFFVSLADNVISNPPKSVGIGTIVGSAIFNILIIIGVSGIVAGRIPPGYLKLNWRPLARDSVFYLISILALIAVVLTGEVANFYEGLILMFLYALYLLFMYFNKRIFRKVDSCLGIITSEAPPKEGAVGPVATLNDKEEEAEDGTDQNAAMNISNRRSSMALGKGLLMEPIEEEIKEGYFGVLKFPSNSGKADSGFLRLQWRRFYYILMFPVNLLFRFTVPDTNFDAFKGFKACWASFVCSVIHIAILSHFLVFSAAKFGCIVGISPAVMGLTFLAAGTSVPDTLTSVAMVYRGQGDGAVANSIGSNVFDILICLGLPWFLGGLIYGPSQIATDDLVISIGFLFGVLIVLVAVLAINKMHLGMFMGIFLCVLYVLYVIFELFIHPII